ncbi:AsmA family protein [Aequorivita vladivostokensis]|uniref:Membrane protein n=1 Tax=Aequorivita vladivostokensis TaxID=171194 RepID=A0ABR5DM25_9FLAO|nr:AsmA-like C-terminal region-containing protein [Aequorivita vladivostokensis]KJJ39826.1 membrane protein [Aequorivita vladivostokensis]
MKKALKIIGIILGILILLLIAAPFIFKGSLEKMLKRTINENLNATVAWEDLDLSLFSSFPDASLQLNNFSVINKAPFEGDTLASGKTLSMDMGIMQLFKKSNEAIKVDEVKIDEAFVNIKIDSLGNANYDIAIKDDAPAVTEGEESAGGFTFDLKNYEITNSRINYLDEATNTYLMLTEVQHEGSGDLSQEISNLDTKTEAFASFKIDSTEYLTKNRISLDAIFKLDLKNQKYTFLENEAKINELPLTFDGYVKVNETNNQVDLTFKTPSSDFKNFLAVIPETYVKQINDVKTTGNFTVNGMLKGIVDSTHIPTMDIKIASDNASFKYPDLPKTVDNITIDAQLKNETGLLNDTYLNIPKLTFRIDNEPFRMNGSIKNMTENPLVNMEMQGTLNLANIEKVLPVEMEQKLSGIFKADVIANFDMESVEKERNDQIDARGTASLTNFNYDAGFKNELKVANANLAMQPGSITLKELNAKTGQTDIKASGNIQNLIPFLMSKQDLKGRFEVQSNTFNVNDFMASEDSVSENNSKEKGTAAQKTASSEAVKIPDFLDATLDFNADKVIYDNLELKNAKGTAAIANETITISNFTSDIFGGNIALSGNVSTKTETPTFAMALDLSKIDIDQSFKELEMFQFLVPIAKALQGSLNTKFELNGQLTNDLSPKLSTLAGTALAQIITAEVDPQQAPLLAALGNKVSFLNLDRLSLRDVSTNFTFNNGKIEVKPFDFDIKGINVAVAGTHGLDKSIDYNVTMDVPAKYLGNDVTKLLQNLSPKEADAMSVALPIGLKGTFTNPQVSLNAETAINALTKQLLAKQKDKLINQGTDILGGILSGGTKQDSTKTNTNTNQQQTTQQQNTQIIKDVLGGILGGKKKKADTTKTGN